MMKNVFIFVSALCILNACCVEPNGKTSERTFVEKATNYQLVWSDEFDYNGLPDSSKWEYDTEGNDAGWGNAEAQYYTDSDSNNAFVANGVLNIVALHKSFEGKQFTSARLMSKANWKYGRVEVNARLPKGVGTWSAIWMMPGGWTYSDGNWPDVGEIDIMEHVGHNLGVVHASAHSKDYQWQKDTQKTATVFVPEADKEFHTYIMEWSPEVMHIFVDDSLYFEYQNEGLGKSKWPYDKPFYLILNLAIGGVWGKEKGIDEKAFPQLMEVDYVRIYQQTD